MKTVNNSFLSDNFDLQTVYLHIITDIIYRLINHIDDTVLGNRTMALTSLHKNENDKTLSCG